MIDKYKGLLGNAIAEGETEKAVQLTREALAEGIAPLDIIQGILVPALTEVGNRFQAFEIFLPELMMAGDAASAATELLEEAIAAGGGERPSSGTIIIGTVAGDIHDIGKNIVATLLRSHGFNVVDLGRDVPAIRFIEEAERAKASIIAMSSLMTTTRPAQRDTLNLLRELGKRDAFKVIVGGGCVTPEWAEEIGADGYAQNAAEAVELCKNLLGIS